MVGLLSDTALRLVPNIEEGEEEEEWGGGRGRGEDGEEGEGRRKKRRGGEVEDRQTRDQPVEVTETI